MPSESKIITATTFIDKVIEFILLEPNREKWSTDANIYEESRRVRLHQLVVLIPLFLPELAEKQDIRSQLEMILSGNFVHLRDDSLYQDVFVEMVSAIEDTGMWEGALYKKLTTRDIEHTVSKFIDFKCKVQQLQWFNAGIMEISYGYYYPVMITDEISQSIDTGMIDRFLSMVISPTKRSFRRTQLIRDFGYPKADVFELEMEEDW